MDVRKQKNSLDEFLWLLYNENNLHWEEMSLTVTDPVHQTRGGMKGHIQERTRYEHTISA
jgi:hypothetical protein